MIRKRFVISEEELRLAEEYAALDHRTLSELICEALKQMRYRYPHKDSNAIRTLKGFTKRLGSIEKMIESMYGNVPIETEELTSIQRLRALKGYVYLIQAGDYYKIGVTKKHPHKRLEALSKSGALPFEGAVISFLYVSFPYTVENELHKKYAEYRTRGEWFKFEAIPEEFVK